MTTGDRRLLPVFPTSRLPALRSSNWNATMCVIISAGT
jgi:hypothetical protein